MNQTTTDQPIPMGYDDLGTLIELMRGDEKHDPSAHSTLDVLWVLYNAVLAIQNESIDDPMRDRLFISKGHGPMALYAVLAAKGLLDVADLPSYGKFSSSLGWHPDRLRIRSVEISSGSLGHGLAIACGSLYALRLTMATTPRVFCLMGDGELDEGSVHEAIALAGRLELGSLIAIVIDNHSASLRWPGGIAARFRVEGWRTNTVSANDHGELLTTLQDGDVNPTQAPRAVVCEVRS
jgi:transketolase